MNILQWGRQRVFTIRGQINPIPKRTYLEKEYNRLWPRYYRFLIYHNLQINLSGLKNNMYNRKMFHPLLLVHSKYVFNVILVVVTRLAITFTKY